MRPQDKRVAWIALSVFAVVFALELLCRAAFGQVIPSSPGVTNPVVQFQANGFGYQYDQRGNSTMLYDLGNGMTGYQSRDRNGYVTSQGTVFDTTRNRPPVERLGVPPLSTRPGDRK